MGPSDGNLHQIEATDLSAFLDVISPPYSDERDCEYFRPVLPAAAGTAGTAVTAARAPGGARAGAQPRVAVGQTVTLQTFNPSFHTGAFEPLGM